MGTDGVDGNSPVAGAVIDETTIPRALGMGLNPMEYLEENNSYEFFTQLGTVIDTGGHTGTNVNDVFIGLVGHDKDYALEQ
jgi:glycerate 2-kinase